MRPGNAIAVMLTLGLFTGVALAADTPTPEPVTGDRTPPRLSFVDGQVSFWRPGAVATRESAVEARRRGADDYLVKPFEMPELLLALHRALEQQKSPARAASSGVP